MCFQTLFEAIQASLKDSYDYSMYMLANSTKMEIYFGVSRDVDNRYKEHKKGEVKSTAAWNFQDDEIKMKTISSGHTQEEASEKAPALEQQTTIRGYTIIQTSDI
ncbi:MAG: GIY-YIG nuclease family protein [Deltaproteobacteria bacterium]|nr:GIY-YIG nuclease family protein [Deltaproteobacteria bacterium]